VSALAWRSPSDLLSGTTESISVGDMIGTGENFHPHYHVIAVTEDRAWIRDTQHGTDHIIPIDRCRKVERPRPDLSIIRNQTCN
jgi:hypothetical protein